MENKNKNGKKEQEKLLFKTKNKVIVTTVISVVVLLLVAVFMYIESKDGQLIIINHTGLNLNYVKGKFVFDKGDLSEETTLENIKVNETRKQSIDPVNLYKTDADYQINLKFDGYNEVLVDAGTFNDTFEGNIKIYFKKTNDPNRIKVKIKAENGLLPSMLIDCNEEYTIDLKNAEVLE